MSDGHALWSTKQLLATVWGGLRWSIFVLGAMVLLAELLVLYIDGPTTIEDPINFWLKLLLPGGIVVAIVDRLERYWKSKLDREVQ